jgi:tetratricopeptide (TPR) repeat protein
MAKQVLAVAPTSTTANELAGLANYSLGKWADASKHLTVVYQRSQEASWLPVLMDCARARKRWMEVDQLWTDLRELSPGADMMAEGRIVYAGSLADRGKLADAITLLDRSVKREKRPRAYDIRTWYALADLYERAGNVPKARALFLQVAKIAPEAYDAAERASSLT